MTINVSAKTGRKTPAAMLKELREALPYLANPSDPRSLERLAAAIAFLSGETLGYATDTYITKIFKHLGEQIQHCSTVPAGDERSLEEWHGDMFNAANSLLFERLAQVRQELQAQYDERKAKHDENPDLPEMPDANFKNPALNTKEAYAQRDALFNNRVGTHIITAVMALNQGAVIEGSKALYHFDYYHGNEGRDDLLRDMWFGTEGRQKDTEDSYVGGLIVTFLRWNPADGRLSTLMGTSISHQATKLKKAQADASVEPLRLYDPGDNPLDLREWRDRIKETSFNVGRFDDPDYRRELSQAVSEVIAAIGTTRPREADILTAYFNGAQEDNVPDSTALISTLGLVSQRHNTPITREAFRQLKVSAIECFEDIWSQKYPDLEQPDLSFMRRKSVEAAVG